MLVKTPPISTHPPVVRRRVCLAMAFAFTFPIDNETASIYLLINQTPSTLSPHMVHHTARHTPFDVCVYFLGSVVIGASALYNELVSKLMDIVFQANRVQKTLFFGLRIFFCANSCESVYIPVRFRGWKEGQKEVLKF